MKNQSTVEVDGAVLQALPNTMFRVQLTDGRLILVTLKGKMRRAYVRIFPGDRVKEEIAAIREARGRIIYKY